MRTVAFIALLAACGDDLAGVAIEDYAAALRAADCKYLVGCGVLRDLESCGRANLGPYAVAPRFLEAVRDGSVIWHSRAAAQCLETRATLTCDREDPARRYKCEPLWEPRLLDGERCKLDAQCVGGECFPDDELAECSAGTCIGRSPPVAPGIGDSCRVADCAAGYCDQRQICVPLAREGEHCIRDYECEVGLACGGNQCTQLPGHGEPCTSQNCRIAGDVCSSLTYRCATGGVLGVSCGTDDDCSPYYECGPDRQCVEPERHVGDRCDSDAQCRDPSSYCESATNTCRIRQPEGTACSYSYECESFVCDAQRGVCSQCE